MSAETDKQSVEGLWDVEQLAKFLKASRSWVYHSAQEGRVPCIKVGGMLRFDPVKIRAWINGPRSAR